MSEIALVALRYDGRDAANHEIDLFSLGESLQGMARVIAVLGNFAVTGNDAKQLSALDVRVVAREPRANCYTIEAALQFAQQQQLLSGGVSAAVGAFIAFAFNRAANRRDEMDRLHASLNQCIEALAGNNAQVVERMATMLETIVDSLKPAMRQAVEPVGRSCTSMTVANTVIIDEAAATEIRRDEPEQVDEERAYSIRITELDLENKTAKVRLDIDESDRRLRAVISDPMLGVASNEYLLSFMNQQPLSVRAKAVLRAGEIVQLHISTVL